MDSKLILEAVRLPEPVLQPNQPLPKNNPPEYFKNRLN